MEGRVPERYRTAAKDCEHCHINRDRHDTYLVYNEDEDEWKQVGKTCLQSYTSGLNAETCALFASVMAEIARISNDTDNHTFNAEELANASSHNSMHSYSDYPMEYARKKAYAYVLERGYTSGQTGRDFARALADGWESTREITDANINEVTTWLDTLAQGDWSRNARAV